MYSLTMYKCLIVLVYIKRMNVCSNTPSAFALSIVFGVFCWCVYEGIEIMNGE